jgi:hypothetical protein
MMKLVLRNFKIPKKLFKISISYAFVLSIGIVFALGLTFANLNQISQYSKAAVSRLGTKTGPAPDGCYYQYVQCLRAPCDPIKICPSASPTTSPSPTPQQPTKIINAMVVAYLPPEGIAYHYPEAVITDPIAFTKNQLFPAMKEASKYHGYSNPRAFAALEYQVQPSAIFIENNPPRNTAYEYSYDYGELFNKYNVCNYAKQNNIGAVFLWAAGQGIYEGKMYESAVTGLRQETNGAHLSYCDDKTIVVYGLNYERGLAEALESYGHHLEEVFSMWRPEYRAWSDFDKPRNDNLWGRGDSCGDVHNPPNARCEYDRSNANGWLECGSPTAPSSVLSDCQNWKPVGPNQLQNLDCKVWGCSELWNGPDAERYIIWWMQNMPGYANGLTLANGKPVPSWWDYIAQPDAFPAVGQYSQLSGQLYSNNAIFNFEFDGGVEYHRVDISNFSDFRDFYPEITNNYYSPIHTYNPARYSEYKCGATLYWRVNAMIGYRVKAQSPVTQSVVNCDVPSPAYVPMRDLTIPSVYIEYPTEGMSFAVNSSVPVRMVAYDNIALKSVRLTANGVSVCNDTTAPYSCQWTPTTTGAFALQAIATDLVGNTNSFPAQVNVQ